MSETLLGRIADALFARRLQRLDGIKPQRIAVPRLKPVQTPTQSLEGTGKPMPLSLLHGYKTYIVAIAMVLTAICQLLGVELPSFDGQAAGQLLMEGLAILFLRKSIAPAQ
jgi:hypothetical protein